MESQAQKHLINMLRILTTFLFLFPAALTAQNGWDFQYITVLHLQHGDDTALLNNLKLTVQTADGKPFNANRYTNQFWINPPKTTLNWRTQKRTYADYSFPFAGTNYVMVFDFGQGYQMQTANQQLQVLIEDESKGKNKIETKIITIDPRKIYHIGTNANDNVFNNGRPQYCGQPVFAPEVIKLYKVGEIPPIIINTHYSGFAISSNGYTRFNNAVLTLSGNNLRMATVDYNACTTTEGTGVSKDLNADTCEFSFTKSLTVKNGITDTAALRVIKMYEKNAGKDYLNNPQVLTLLLHTGMLENRTPKKIWLSVGNEPATEINLCSQTGIYTDTKNDVLAYFIPLPAALLQEMQWIYGSSGDWFYQLRFDSPLSGWPLLARVKYGSVVDVVVCDDPPMPTRIVQTNNRLAGAAMIPDVQLQPVIWQLNFSQVQELPALKIESPVRPEPVAPFNLIGKVQPYTHSSIQYDAALYMNQPNGKLVYSVNWYVNEFAEASGRVIKLTPDSLTLQLTQMLQIYSTNPELNWQQNLGVQDPMERQHSLQNVPQFRAGNDTLYINFNSKQMILPDTFSLQLADNQFIHYTAANWKLVRMQYDTNQCELHLSLKGGNPGAFAADKYAEGEYMFLHFRSPLSGNMIAYQIRRNEEIELRMMSNGGYISRLAKADGAYKGRMVLQTGNNWKQWDVSFAQKK